MTYVYQYRAVASCAWRICMARRRTIDMCYDGMSYAYSMNMWNVCVSGETWGETESDECVAHTYGMRGIYRNLL